MINLCISIVQGLLTTIAPLDREESDLHVLSVIVQDKGNDNFQHTNYTTVSERHFPFPLIKHLNFLIIATIYVD